MFKSIRKSVSAITNVFTAKSQLAAESMLTSDEKISKMALDVIDKIVSVQKAKVKLEETINQTKRSAKTKTLQAEKQRDIIQDNLALGENVSDSQYLLALQSETIALKLKERVVEMENELPKYDIAHAELESALSELKIQKELLQLNAEGAKLGVVMGSTGIDVEAKYTGFDVNGLLTKISLTENVELVNSSLELNSYKQSFKK